EVLGANAELVYEHDHFRQLMGEDARIEHEPPPLGQERGEVIGGYCLIRLKSGDVIREVMTKAEIEYIRTTFSKNQRADAPWKLHWGEMARKTVFRRAVKQVAFRDQDIVEFLNRPEEYDEIPLAETPLPPRITSQDVTESGLKQTRQRRAKA